MITKLIYYWWIPVIIIDMIFYAWLTNNNNLYGGKWFWFMWIATLFPVWTIIARHSKDIIFDGIIYDIIVFIIYTCAIGYFSKKFVVFNSYNWMGFGLILLGIFLLKCK